MGGRWWTHADVSPAVFKTVCGALLRRPGWVRFPSIPANFGGHDSQVDSHSSGRLQLSADDPGLRLWQGIKSLDPRLGQAQGVDRIRIYDTTVSVPQRGSQSLPARRQIG